MIKVNGKDFEWEENLTVMELMQKKKYTYSRIVVTVNGVLVPKEEYGSKQIIDEDDVQFIHLMAGG